MAQIGYLLARLPVLTAEAGHLAVGPEEFSDLIVDAQLRFWACGALDWLRLANWRSARRKLPLPFPDASARPMLAWSGDPWAEYYRRFTSLSAPAILRLWSLEDGATIAARAGIDPRHLGLPANYAVNSHVDAFIQPATAKLDDAAVRDRTTLRFQFDWLDQQVFSSGQDAPDRVHAYSLKLLVLLRNGRRLEHSAAA